jgi:hypothetical protein
MTFLFLTSCIKYEDDEFISFKTPEERIQGTWTLDKYTVGGVDSTKEALDAICNGKIDFSIHYNNNYVSIYEIDTGCRRNIEYKSTYYFRNRKTEFSFGPIGNRTITVGALNTYINWDIIKLTRKKIHLTCNFLNKKNELFLSK